MKRLHYLYSLYLYLFLHLFDRKANCALYLCALRFLCFRFFLLLLIPPKYLSFFFLSDITLLRALEDTNLATIANPFPLKKGRDEERENRRVGGGVGNGFWGKKKTGDGVIC